MPDSPPLTLTSPYDPERPDDDKCRIQCNINNEDYTLIKMMRLRWGNLESTLGTLVHGLSEACREFQIKDYQQYESYVRLIKSITFEHNGKVYRPYADPLPTGGTPSVLDTKTSNGDDGGRTQREHLPLEDAPSKQPNAKKRATKGHGGVNGGKGTEKG
jgi:hypothetical protein